MDEVLAQYAKDTGSGKELNQDQFEDVMKILSKDVAGRVTVTCGIMVGCPTDYGRLRVGTPQKQNS